MLHLRCYCKWSAFTHRKQCPGMTLHSCGGMSGRLGHACAVSIPSSICQTHRYLLFLGEDACLHANASHSWGGMSSSRRGCTAVFDVQHLTVSWTLPVNVEAVSSDGGVGAFIAQESGKLLPAQCICSSGLFGHS